MTYIAHAQRYEMMQYRFCGQSGLKLPALTLGLWHNFGNSTPYSVQREMVITAFDLGITHFDLANNYGPPAGSAETNFGRLMREDLKPYRDELLISSKAGWDMWPGPYGQGGGGRKYVLASLDQSLQRLGLDYVDIFYSHRFDPDTPLEETMGALATAVQQGKALYVGLSSYSPGKTREAAKLLKGMGVRAADSPAGLQHVQSLDRGEGAQPAGRAGDRAWAASPSPCWRRACCRRSISAAFRRRRASTGPAAARSRRIT